MTVVVEPLASHYADAAGLNSLVAKLESYDFADKCFIGAMMGNEVIIKCNGAPHGVTADVTRLDNNAMQRLLRMLAASVGRAGAG